MKIVGPVAIEIHDEKLFHGRGAVNVWANRLAATNTRNTKKAAPVNKRTRKFPGNPPRGHLKANISSSVTHLGTKVIGIDTHSKAKYSIFVIRGTKTQYRRDVLGRFAPNAVGFPLPANNFGPFRRSQRIRGQKANNFMVEGLRLTATTHPAIRGASRKFMRFG